MKKITTIISLLAGVAMFFSCEKGAENEPPIIDMEYHYDMVYMLGAEAEDEDGIQHWDSADPMPMTKTDNPDVFTYTLDLVRSTENKLLKFSLTVASWDKAEFLVPAVCEDGQQYAFLKEGENKLVKTSEATDGVGNLKDWFFGIPEGQSGTYKLEVNPITLVLKATKLESLPDPDITEWVEGNLYLVGDATPNGWEVGNPTPMVRDGNIHTWEGNLAKGEFKILTEFKWECLTYRPGIAGTEISKNGITDETVAVDPAGDAEGDPKWKVVEPGKYRFTLDIEKLKLTVECLGE